ncbi:MAG: non-hydrolyzing UDP-N-acetylglucosamine 2-epimerase [Phocaeicola sp.]
MIKVLIVFGTRPEAIKMAPLVKAFQLKEEQVEMKVCVTAQHRQMLDQVLDFFQITPDYDLNLMKAKQSLHSVTANVVMDLKPILEEFNPDYVLVHGDTATSTAAALSAFYSGCKVVHIEAGLRTWNKLSPFPEEMNRQITGRLADIHMAPTVVAKENLLKEGIDENAVFVTGNTVIDALLSSVKILEESTIDEITELEKLINLDKEVILVTGHRRENFGQGFINICTALKTIAKNNPSVDIIYPVHLNPAVQEPVKNILSDIPNVKLIAPLSYPSFVWLMEKSKLIITDSGGVQEEAPSLGKPVLVMRDTTERPEAVEAGTVLLVGTDVEKIVTSTQRLLTDEIFYKEMSNKKNPYGDGNASARIVDYIIKTEQK